MDEEIITLEFGFGGLKSYELITSIISKYTHLRGYGDSAILSSPFDNLAFTTDSYVVSPIFFNGGDIGKLAVSGTINDLSVVGAKPIAISLSLIIEEGFELNKLKKILHSIKTISEQEGVKIITGDTKVVEKGKAEGIYINTAGIGEVIYHPSYDIGNGDKIIITGPLGNHAIAVMAAKYNIEVSIKSDVAPLWNKVKAIFESGVTPKLLKDITRGGLGTILNEIAIEHKVDIHIFEDKLPIEEEVQAVAEMLGYDILYLANEGNLLVIVKEEDAEKVVKVINSARVIGEVRDGDGKVFGHTVIGGTRQVNMLTGSMYPRIC